MKDEIRLADSGLRRSLVRRFGLVVEERDIKSSDGREEIRGWEVCGRDEGQ
jgi:hypothetical protein